MIATLVNDAAQDLTAALKAYNMVSLIVSALNGGTVAVQVKGTDGTTETDWVASHTFTEAGHHILLRGEGDQVRLLLTGNTGNCIVSATPLAGRD